jgi:transposase
MTRLSWLTPGTGCGATEGSLGRGGRGDRPLCLGRPGEQAFLSELRGDLRARRYQPVPVREVMIPKPGGKRRRLGIATVRDRVVQAALKTVLEHGLVRPSFIPPEPFRALRDLTRYRKAVVEERARESQRLHKVLEDAGVKLSSVASSVLTKSGREMIDALIAGQRDPAVLAEMAKGRMRAKIPRLQDAMAGRFNEHHGLLCRAMLARIDQADATVDALTGRIDELLDPYEAAVSLLVTIPGVARRNAQVILAEIGADMSRFPTAGHLASWAGMCPGTTNRPANTAPGGLGTARNGSGRHSWKPARPPAVPRTPTSRPNTPRSADDAGHSGPPSPSATPSW